MPQSTAFSPLTAAVLQEAVHRIEAEGPLQDRDELAQALSAQGHSAQLRLRAMLLAERLGLPECWQRCRHAAAAAALLLALLMVGSGFLLAQTVLGQERSVNVVMAWVSLLGAHAVSLLLWFLSLPGAGRRGDAWLGRAVLQATERLARWSGAGQRSALLLQSFEAVVRRHGLLGWLTGMLSHSVWVLALLMAWGGLAFGFAFRAYTLTWESTLFSPFFLQDFARYTGALPALLGFTVPDAALSSPEHHAGALVDARAWAWWLMGSLLAYGLLPRLLLAALCWWRWSRGLQGLASSELDLADPITRRLVGRLEALQAPHRVLDPERAAPASPVPASAAAPRPGTWVLLGFELPPGTSWPPLEGPAPAWSAQLDGGSATRASTLARLTQQPTQALLLLVNGPASPDRGTADFVRQAMRHSTCGALWLHAAQPADVARWQNWLLAEPLLPAGLRALPDAAAAQAWLHQALADSE